MTEQDPVQLLNRLDRPVEPTPEVRERIWRSLAMELDHDGVASTDPPVEWSRGPSIGIGFWQMASVAALVLVVGLSAVWLSRPDDPTVGGSAPTPPSAPAPSPIPPTHPAAQILAEGAGDAASFSANAQEREVRFLCASGGMSQLCLVYADGLLAVVPLSSGPGFTAEIRGSVVDEPATVPLDQGTLAIPAQEGRVEAIVRDGTGALVASMEGGLFTRETENLTQFDFESFVADKLGGAFGQDGDSVGAVIMVHADQQSDVEPLLNASNLPELEGYSFVPADLMEQAAERFADDRDMEPWEGEWVGYGLIPRFDDSPTDEWVEALDNIPNSHVVAVDASVPAAQVPAGWDHIGDLPVRIVDGAIVEAVDAGIVVLQPDSTALIGFDGSWNSGEAPPLSIPTLCCGSAYVLSAGDVLILLAEGSTEAWILDVETLTWRQADARPDSGYVLGSARIDDDVYVVTAAARTREATSTLSALDLDSDRWRRLEDVPTPISVGGASTDGERLFVAGTHQGPSNHIIGEREPAAYEYVPGAAWTELPRIPIDGQSATVAWVEGTGLLAWNYGLESAMLDQSGSWRPTGDVPMPPAECNPMSFPTASGIAGICGGIALFDAETESWNQVPHPLDTRVVATETALYGLFQADRSQTQLISFPIW